MKKKPANPIKDREKVLDIQDYLKSQNERDFVLFVTGISTGYRAGDLVEFKKRTIQKSLDDGYFEILENKKKNSKNIRQKNLKPRQVKINVNLAVILSEYIEDMEDYEYVFKSRKGSNSHITVPSVSRILRAAGEEFGLVNITAHSMRKTYAYFIYVNSKFNITLVKDMLGHGTIEETRRYLGLDKETYDKYNDSLDELIII